MVKFKMSCNGSTEFDVVDIYVAEGELDFWQPLLREVVLVGCDWWSFGIFIGESWDFSELLLYIVGFKVYCFIGFLLVCVQCFVEFY